VGTATITSSTPFTYGTTCYQLGTTGQKLTVSEVGQFDSLRATSANLNGAISQSTTSTTGTTTSGS